jgi:hypothetical protein
MLNLVFSVMTRFSLAGRRGKVYAKPVGIDEHAAAGPPGSAGHWQPLADVETAGNVRCTQRVHGPTPVVGSCT